MYITAADIEARLGSDDYAVLVGSDAHVQARVGQAMTDAAGEIDGYVGQRYGVPLDPVPSSIQRVAVDIAIYRLSGDSRTTEDRRKRYEDAVAFLKGVSRGEVSLGLSAPADDDASGDPDRIAVTSRPRQFHRGNLSV